MESTAIARFFGVVKRPRTWLTFLFHWLAFPLGLFYFIFLVVGLSLGISLLVVWVGIPILLIVAGAWWLFGSFERYQAHHMLGADVAPAPRSWESVDGVWAKLKAHFGNGYTWRDLAYLLAKLPFGIASFTLVVTLMALVVWLGTFPIGWLKHIQWLSWGQNSGITPTWWQAALAVPAAVLLFVASLHVLNGWGWVCAKWAELVFGRASQIAARAAAAPPPEPEPLVSTGPPRGAAPSAAGLPPAQWPAPGPAPWPAPTQAQPPAAPVVRPEALLPAQSAFYPAALPASPVATHDAGAPSPAREPPAAPPAPDDLSRTDPYGGGGRSDET
jgi:Putative sensor